MEDRHAQNEVDLTDLLSNTRFIIRQNARNWWTIISVGATMVIVATSFIVTREREWKETKRTVLHRSDFISWTYKAERMNSDASKPWTAPDMEPYNQ